MTSNQLRYWELKETIRSNRAKEAETRRSNRATERLTQAYQLGSLELRARELSEIQRRNLASEGISLATLAETSRHNVQYEQETKRHNLSNEALTARQLDISQASLNETVRSHKVQESLTKLTLAENIRHNQAQENLGFGQLAMESRYKQATIQQGQQRLSLDAQHAFNERQRVVNDTYNRIEQARRNKAQEELQEEQNRLRAREVKVKEGQLVIQGLDTGVKVGSAIALAMG